MDEYILGVDVDGVIMDYTEGLRRYVAKARGVDPATLLDPDSWNFESWAFKDRDDFLEHHTGAVEAGLFLNSPAMPGASEVLWRLSDKGIRIRIITSCFVGKGRHALAGRDRFLYLDKENIPFKDICFIDSKSDVAADLYIEDSPSQIANLQANFKDVLIYSTKYNQHIPGTHASSWYDAELVILHQYAQWQKAMSTR